ncbi:MAG: hypothetical protein HQK51_12110 [Oligoflexia bacterium]|nr:hypothetical protein [Oligoflexia bacterium]
MKQNTQQKIINFTGIFSVLVPILIFICILSTTTNTGWCSDAELDNSNSKIIQDIDNQVTVIQKSINVDFGKLEDLDDDDDLGEGIQTNEFEKNVKRKLRMVKVNLVNEWESLQKEVKEMAPLAAQGKLLLFKNKISKQSIKDEWRKILNGQLGGDGRKGVVQVIGPLMREGIENMEAQIKKKQYNKNCDFYITNAEDWKKVEKEKKGNFLPAIIRNGEVNNILEYALEYKEKGMIKRKILKISKERVYKVDPGTIVLFGHKDGTNNQFSELSDEEYRFLNKATANHIKAMCSRSSRKKLKESIDQVTSFMKQVKTLSDLNSRLCR